MSGSFDLPSLKKAAWRFSKTWKSISYLYSYTSKYANKGISDYQDEGKPHSLDYYFDISFVHFSVKNKYTSIYMYCIYCSNHQMWDTLVKRHILCSSPLASRLLGSGFCRPLLLFLSLTVVAGAVGRSSGWPFPCSFHCFWIGGDELFLCFCDTWYALKIWYICWIHFSGDSIRFLQIRTISERDGLVAKVPRMCRGS